MNANWHKGLANLDTQNFPVRDFEPRAQRIISQLDKHAPWLIKDPRCCLTFSGT